MKVHYSVLACRSYRYEHWEVVEGQIDFCNKDFNTFKSYLYEIILIDFARFTNLLVYCSEY